MQQKYPQTTMKTCVTEEVERTVYNIEIHMGRGNTKNTGPMVGACAYFSNQNKTFILKLVKKNLD